MFVNLRFQALSIYKTLNSDNGGLPNAPSDHSGQIHLEKDIHESGASNKPIDAEFATVDYTEYTGKHDDIVTPKPKSS